LLPGFIVLVEFAVLAIAVYYAYGREIKENSKVVTGRIEGGESSGEYIFVGVCDYLMKVFNFCDIWYLFYASIDAESQSLTQSFAPA
jgi:hypothetical protein